MSDPYLSTPGAFQQGQRVRIGETMYDYPTARNTRGKVKPGDTLIVRQDYKGGPGQGVLLSRENGEGDYLAWPYELTAQDDSDG